MKFKGRDLYAGAVLLRLRGWHWHPWTVSDWSVGTGDVYGRSHTGEYERMSPFDTVWELPKPKLPRYKHKPALGPKLADLCRQGRVPN